MNIEGFMVLEKYGTTYGIPHREPHSGPHRTQEEAQGEIDRYFTRWPEDRASTVFAIFSLTHVTETSK